MRPSAQAGAHPVFFSIWERKACDTQEAFLTHLVYAVSHCLGTEMSVPSSPDVSIEQSLERQSSSPSTRFHWPPAHYGLASRAPLPPFDAVVWVQKCQEALLCPRDHQLAGKKRSQTSGAGPGWIRWI